MSLVIFSKNLKYLMKKRGVTKESLRVYLRIQSTSRISAWLEGRAGPRREQLIDLCDALDYYDIYRLFTIDIQKDKGSTAKALPADVSMTIKNIHDLAGSLLVKDKKI